jgi:two-component system, OmpR family, alkaline phosphatase synthesis response regulator PhoP
VSNPPSSANPGPVDPAGNLHPGEDEIAASTILIVDDNEHNLELIQAYLEDLGCRIRTARDGLEALRSVDEVLPDMILLDVMMPRMSGFQACSRIKSNPQTRDIPVLMITALNEVGDVERAVESGADDFLTKPVNKLELLTRVRSLLRVRHLKRDLEHTLEQMRRLGQAAPKTDPHHPSQPPPGA